MVIEVRARFIEERENQKKNIDGNDGEDG